MPQFFMSHHLTSRRLTLGFAAALLAAGVAYQAPVDAGPAKRKGPGEMSRIETPLGLQGLNGAGSHVVIPFSIVDRRPRAHRVEGEWAFDRNGDGEITSDEFQPLTHAPLDVRDTGRVRRARSRFPRVIYKSARGVGAAHALVWDSLVDAPDLRAVRTDILRTETGREVLERGVPIVIDSLPGVQVRLRLRQGRGPRSRGPFTATNSFSLNNAGRPGVRVEELAQGAEPTEFFWDALEASSRPVAIQFDYLRVDPAFGVLTELSAAELDSLPWRPCTLSPQSGDAELGLGSSPDGVQHRFTWDASADLQDLSDEYVIRARTYEPENRVVGIWDYRLTPFTPSD